MLSESSSIVKKFLFVAIVLSLFNVSSVFAGGIVIPVGRSELIHSANNMGEAMVANPDIADIHVHGKRELSIIGKEIGQTTVRMFDGQHNLIRSIGVTVGYDLPAIRKALKEFLPYESVNVEMINSNIALTGEISGASAADKAVKIVGEFVQPAYGEKKDKSKKEDSPFNVINLMTITGGQQVMLRVRVGEVKRTALRNLGIDMNAVKAGGNTVFSIATGGGIDAFGSGSEVLGVGGFNIGGIGETRGIAGLKYTNSKGEGVAGLIDALERNGLFKMLAEPNLVAMSGEEAKFLAGGEFPVPVAQDLGTINIEYKPFGVSVKFKPFVLSENRIRVAVEPEVSEITDQGAIEISGFIIPALTTRRAKTTVELAPGESFMIAGLIQDNMESVIDQIPGIGEIPVLSALFRSTDYKREETELVIAVTPYLVDPMASNDVKLPTDELRPASVMESFFYGALGSLSGDASRVSQMPTVEGPIGFMVD